MVNQTKQITTHTCKWGSCKEEFDSMALLWKHVEQHVDNASSHLIHIVNDDDDVPVKAPQNTAMTRSSTNSVATSPINQSRNVYPARISTVMNGTSNINNGQNINLMISPNLNLQSMQQTTQSRLQQQGSRILTSQTSPMIMFQQTQTYLTSSQKQQQPFMTLPGANYQFQPTFLIGTQIQQQQQIIQSASQSANVTPLGSLPNPITIDDNTMDVDPPVINVNNHQRSLITQAQKKGINSSQNTKK